MMRAARPMVILMADDDADDRLLTRDAFEKSRVLNELHCVEDGEALLEYLQRRGRFEDPASAPRKDGREALREIKADPELRSIPVVVLTTSKAEEDILRTYNLGANSFITKPVTFQGLVEVVRVLGEYWFQIVELPVDGADGAHG
jgi:CheY-like chemotaxis protein